MTFGGSPHLDDPDCLDDPGSPSAAAAGMQLRCPGRKVIVKKQQPMDKPRKENGKPWSQEEINRLLHSVRKHGLENINWADVAKDVPGRTGKQCREKWKNDLRPDISKEPWTLQEEYILALAHSKHGNRWADIAKFLPRRAENTIKNHWYATNRAKAEVKTRTFLWVYGDMVDKKLLTPCQDTFDKALVQYATMDGVVPVSNFVVADDYFIKAHPPSTAAELMAAIVIPPLVTAPTGAPAAGGRSSGGGARPPGSQVPHAEGDASCFVKVGIDQGPAKKILGKKRKDAASDSLPPAKVPAHGAAMLQGRPGKMGPSSLDGADAHAHVHVHAGYHPDSEAFWHMAPANFGVPGES